MSLKNHFRFAVVESLLIESGDSLSHQTGLPGARVLRVRKGQIFPSHLPISCPRRFLGAMKGGGLFRLKLRLAQNAAGEAMLLVDPGVLPLKLVQCALGKSGDACHIPV